MAVALHNGLTRPETCRHYTEYIAEFETDEVMKAKDALVRESQSRKIYLESITEKIQALADNSDSIRTASQSNIEMTAEAAQKIIETAFTGNPIGGRHSTAATLPRLVGNATKASTRFLTLVSINSTAS